jgi:hypothetical protein
MLKNEKFKPNPRSDFNSLRNVQAGSQVMPIHLGQKPKHFGEGYHGTFFVTEQMMDVWMKIDNDDGKKSIKKILSGPIGVGKSYLSWFLAAMAYANSWLTLYIADASVLITCNESEAQVEICERFFALNQNILTSADFGKLTQLITEDDSDRVVISLCTSRIFSCLLKRKMPQKALFIVDEHGALFDGITPAPDRLNLESLKNLNFWDEAMSGTRVILTGTAHAKFEKIYLKNGMQKYVVYVGPLSLKVFNQLLNAVFSNLHPTVRNYLSTIREEVLRITNRVPRELIILAEMIGTDSHTLDEVKETLKSFEDTRRKQFYDTIKTYYNSLPTESKNETCLALAEIFLPGKQRCKARFEWQFLDFGIVYRVKDGNIEQHYPICPAAKEALMNLYKYCPLPQDYFLALTQDSMDGIQFEDAIFQQFMRLSNIVLKTTDLAGKNELDLHLNIKGFELLQKQPNKYGKDVLIRCYKGYPRFDFVLGYMFFQVSISDFAKHDTGYAKIELSFLRDDGNKNQIEDYLDSVFGGVHKIDIIETTSNKNIKKKIKKFLALKDDQPCNDFKIIYIRGSPGKVNHTGKVEEYPDIRHISYEEIKSKLFGVLIP